MQAVVLACGWACLAILTPGVSARAALPPLIPRSVLFGNPERQAPRLSPDGRRLAFVARSKAGVLNLWVRELEDGRERVVTDDRAGDVFGPNWAPDGEHILTIKQSQGDENWHLYSIDVSSGIQRDLTPFSGTRAENVISDARHPHELLVGLNLRDRRFSDMYRVNLETGALTLDTRNPGDVTEWQVDSSLTIRGCVALDSLTANTILRVRDRASSPWRTLQVWPFLQAGNDRDQRLVSFSRDGRSLLVLSPLGSTTTRLLWLDARTGAPQDSLPADPRADVWCPFDFANAYSAAMVMLDPRSAAVQAYAVDPLVPEWKVVDAALRPDFEALARLHDGHFVIVNRDVADRHWVVNTWTDVGSDRYYLWDRAAQKAELLFTTRPSLDQLTLAHQQPITIRARDGLDIPCYLTLPPGVPATRLPLIMHPHGGPWARDEWGFDPEVQWLANRGYAVLQPQFRGSTGFGKAYVNASIGEWGTERCRTT
jgi:dipeptidyl aminopeptidase/acylaminoacyl peptidase